MHEAENETILEVLIKGNNLNHSVIPSKKKYEILKFLTYGQYPNYKNISHISGAMGSENIDLDSFLQEDMWSSRLVNLSHRDLDKSKFAAYFCSPWNYFGHYSEKKLNFIFRPEDLRRFLNDFAQEYLHKNAQEFMLQNVKNVLNNGHYAHFRKDPVDDFGNHVPERYGEVIEHYNEKLLYEIYNEMLPEYLLEVDLMKSFYILDSLGLKVYSHSLREVEKVASLNFILYTLPAYLKVIYDSTEIYNPIVGLKSAKFINKDDLEKIRLENPSIEEMQYAYVSNSSWNSHGFLLLCRTEKNSLKFGDASVILANQGIKSEKYGIKESDGQRVIFRFKK